MQILINVVKNLLDPNYYDHLPFVEKARELFELIRDLQKMKGMAFAKLKWLAKRLNISKRYVQKILKVLRDAQLIVVKRREQNFYQINPSLMNGSDSAPNAATDKPARRKASGERLNKQAQATLEVGAAKAEESQSQFSDAEAAAIMAAYASSKSAEVTASEPVSAAMASNAAPAAAPEIVEAVEEVAKAVRRDRKYVKPRSIADYLDQVKKRLATLGIEAPRLLVGDVVMKFWTATW